MIKILLIVSIFFKSLMSLSQIHADIDSVDSSLEYYGVASLKLGDFIQINHFYLGGFIELRNEARFNQAIFPNHNWRGYIFLEYNFKLPSKFKNINFYLPLALEHESAHPTMGVRVAADEAFHKIYDGTFRNINLNSLRMGVSLSTVNKIQTMSEIDYQVYLYSRNTPELNNLKLGFSHGFSIGWELKYYFYRQLGFFLSLFDRFIFRSRNEVNGDIYVNENNSVIQINKKYPVIRQLNQLSFSTGIYIDIKKIKRTISFYFKIIHGNKGGFVDSRDNLTLYLFGIATESF